MKKGKKVELVRCEDCAHDKKCPVRHSYCSKACLAIQKRKEVAK